MTQVLAAHTIGGVLPLAIPAERADRGVRPLLTRRRAVDYCHVAAAQCPGRAPGPVAG